jgi:hypothetical protein
MRLKHPTLESLLVYRLTRAHFRRDRRRKAFWFCFWMTLLLIFVIASIGGKGG